MVEKTYSIGEVAQLSGLAPSTLRYYESIGLVGPIMRGQRSKQREYSEADCERIKTLACLQALDMPIADIRTYITQLENNAELDTQSFIQLLEQQAESVAYRQQVLEWQQTYIATKIRYWQARQNHDLAQTTALSEQATKLASKLQVLLQQAPGRQ